MHNRYALAAFLILSSVSASNTCPKMPFNHSNLTNVPWALRSSSCASSSETPYCELIRSIAASGDSRLANSDLPVSGIPIMVPTTSNVIIISPKCIWNVLFSGCHLSTKADTSYLLMYLYDEVMSGHSPNRTTKSLKMVLVTPLWPAGQCLSLPPWLTHKGLCKLGRGRSTRSKTRWLKDVYIAEMCTKQLWMCE